MTARPDEFGSRRLRGWRALAHQWANAVPGGWSGKQIRSVLRRLALVGRSGPVDVEVFGGGRMRLYPFENLTDKHIFANPNRWDRMERDAIVAAISDHGGTKPLSFIDIGANVGAYTIAVMNEARSLGKAVRVLAVEPLEFCRDRLMFNLNASQFSDNVVVLGSAVGPKGMEWELLRKPNNLGETYLAPATTLDRQIPVTPLHDVLKQSGFEQPDIIKIDIEGLELVVLHDYFNATDPENLPALIIAETRRGMGHETAAMCANAGYECLFDNGRNGAYRRNPR